MFLHNMYYALRFITLRNIEVCSQWPLPFFPGDDNGQCKGTIFINEGYKAIYGL
jgi:hypothetical protein